MSVMLFDREDEAFEVFAFGVIDVDGMVGRLCELMEYAHLASRLCGRSEDGQAELFARNGL